MIKKCIFVLIIVLILMSIFFVWQFKQNIINKTNNCYANWDSGRLIIAYIDKHKEWPPSWNSLEPLFVKIAKKGPLDFNQIKSRININFKVDLNLPNLNEQVFVTQKNGKMNYFQAANPNEMIKDYISTKNKHRYISRMNLYRKFQKIPEDSKD